MKKKNTTASNQSYLFGLFLMFFISPFFAQNVGINESGDSPDESAGLHVDFTDKGVLIPRVNLVGLVSTDPITGTIANGLLVYNLTSNAELDEGFYYWSSNESKWMAIAIDDNVWKKQGNEGTDATTDFIGTTDEQDFVIRTDDEERMRIAANGYVGVNEDEPLHALHVKEEEDNGGVFGLYIEEYNRGNAVWIDEHGNGAGLVIVARDFGSSILSFATGDLSGSSADAGGHEFKDLRTSTDDDVVKRAVQIESTGAWTGTDSYNIGLEVNVDGGTQNIAASFNGGRVGVGTSNPQEDLHVNGNVRIDGGLRGGYREIFNTDNITKSDYYVLIGGGNSETITLPDPAEAGPGAHLYLRTQFGNAAATKTIASFSGSEIRLLGAATTHASFDITGPSFEGIILLCDGAVWNVISRQ